jgi:HNH endonuclease
VAKPKTSGISRFINHIVRGENGCWIWTGALKDNGYGAFGGEYKNGYSHIFSYEYFNGVIAEDLEIDHLCRNRACCNPKHLEAVTHQENMLRSPIAFSGINGNKTHCHKGHEFTDKNTWWERSKGRHCKRCHADREQIRRDRKRANSRFICEIYA